MSDLYLALKLVHILGATVLFGTGLGIAFFMFMAHRTGDAATIAHTARIVVIADALFTASAVVAAAGDRRGAGMADRLFAVPSPGSSRRSRSMFWSACAGCRWCGSSEVARSGGRGGARSGSALPARYHRLFRDLVLARLAGVPRRDRDLRADDLEAAVVVCGDGLLEFLPDEKHGGARNGVGCEKAFDFDCDRCAGHRQRRGAKT